jgi:REP element-mobilizing transposase RayT
MEERGMKKMAKERLYHVLVWNREGKELFPEKKDRERFLKLLRKARKSGDFRVYAYCLLKDRLQLLCSCPTGMIGKMLASVEGVYSSYCQGKYKDKAPVLEQELYECGWEGLLDLVRYVHRAPVRAEKRKGLWFRWSSHGDYLALDDRSVDYRVVLSVFGKKETKALKRYKKFIHSPSSQSPITVFYMLPDTNTRIEIDLGGNRRDDEPEEEPYEGSAVLMDEAEVREWEETAEEDETTENESEPSDGMVDEPDAPADVEKAEEPVSPEEIVDTIAEIMGVSPESVRKSGGVPQETAARRVALFILRDDAGLSNAEIGKMLGMAPSTVSKTYNNDELRQELEGRIECVRRMLEKTSG